MYIKKIKGLEFVRMNLTTMQISNRLRVNNDLSITVSIWNLNVIVIGFIITIICKIILGYFFYQ